MLQPVFDNDYMPRIAKYGWPARWYPAGLAGGRRRRGLAQRRSGHVFDRRNGQRRAVAAIPSPERRPTAVATSVDGEAALPSAMPQLITDFTAYDTGKMRMRGRRHRGRAQLADGLGHALGRRSGRRVHRGSRKAPAARSRFELCKGGRQFQCRFDLATGQATLSISGQDMAAWHPTASTTVRGKGQHKILFSNCDDELRLWVDGRVVSFDAPTTYPTISSNTQPDAADLAPVGMASTGAAVRISHLRVLRDIYYIADQLDSIGRGHDVCYQAGKALPGEGSDRRHANRLRRVLARRRISSSCSATTAPRARTAGSGARTTIGCPASC